MKIKRKQKFAMKTANESQAQKYYYRRIKIGAGCLCFLYVISCMTAVYLGYKGSKADVVKLYNNSTYNTIELFMKTAPSNMDSDITFPKYELPDFIAMYAYKQTLSVKDKRRVSPCVALFDNNMNFVSSNLRAILGFNEEISNEGFGTPLQSLKKFSLPIPFRTDKELSKFVDEINSALSAGSKVTAEGYAYEQVLYPESVTIMGKDGSKKTIKISADYDLPSGLPRATYTCNRVIIQSPYNNEAPALSSKYFNKETIKGGESFGKELWKKSNIFKTYYWNVEKIKLTPLGFSNKFNVSEYYGYVPNYLPNRFSYLNTDNSKKLQYEEYYIVSFGTYSPLVLAIEQVQTYSKVNFIDLTLILFAGILLLTVTMLTLLKKRLRQIEQNRKDLIMSIAHEMKTPFGIVRLYGEKILITPDPEAKEECASDMMEEIDEMNSLLQNILDASRLDSGSLKLNKTAFIMNDAVQDVIEGYSPLAEDKNIKLTMNAADKFPVEADNYRIKQVISNLLSNAIKNTPENGKIDITIKKEGKNTAVTVKNTGKPIPKEKLSRIWDAFYKHDENADNSKSGAGLGLSIVKNIILLHGGFCGVENKDDGVEFWFRI